MARSVDRQASRGHEVAAAHDGDRVQHARERRVHRMERAHEPVRALLGGHEPLVRAARTSFTSTPSLPNDFTTRMPPSESCSRALMSAIFLRFSVKMTRLLVVAPERVGGQRAPWPPA